MEDILGNICLNIVLKFMIFDRKKVLRQEEDTILGDIYRNSSYYMKMLIEIRIDNFLLHQEDSNEHGR